MWIVLTIWMSRFWSAWYISIIFMFDLKILEVSWPIQYDEILNSLKRFRKSELLNYLREQDDYVNIPMS